MIRSPISFATVSVLALLALASTDVQAQSALDIDPTSAVRTRAELESLLERYDQVILSPAYSEAVKQDARERSARIQERLTRGDFMLGDEVVLFVRGEPDLPDTVAVRTGANGPMIVLPVFGEIDLHGVLRSEIEPHLSLALSEFIRDPVVRAEGLMRLSVQGTVGQPGFYTVPADMLLSETLMMAGGPGQNANLAELRVERGPSVLYEGEDLQELMRQGRTLDQLNMQAGDQVVLPADGGGFFTNFVAVAGIITSLTFTIFQLTN